MAEIDGSIVMATHPLIASEFNDLGNSTWLITGFALAGAVTQPLVRLPMLRRGTCADGQGSMESSVTYTVEGLSFFSHMLSLQLAGESPSIQTDPTAIG